MAITKVLICGGGIAGPSLAFWLSKLGYDITIVEWFPSLRRSGLQVGIRGQGIQVMRNMGIEQAVCDKLVDESGVQFVDRMGKQKVYFAANKSGREAHSGSIPQYHILRSDLADVLYDATKETTKYVFGVQVTAMEQGSNGVYVRFSDGTQDSFDLVVGADGQSSPTRRMILEPNEPDPIHSLGVYCAFFSVPRPKNAAKIATVCHIPQRRVMATRGDDLETLQVYLAALPPSEKDKQKLNVALKGIISEQREAWGELFHNIGPHGDAVVDAMLHQSSTDDFYSQLIGQVKMSAWSRGRVVLLGDAAYGPSPLSGMGTTAAMVGAYVLAGELARGGRSGYGNEVDTEAALQGYERQLRPFVDGVQKLRPRRAKVGMPETGVGISLLHLALGLRSCLRLERPANRAGADDIGGWRLPEYPELLGI